MPKLGRLPNSGRPRIKLTADLIPATAYAPPPSVDWYSHVPAASWGMDGNDAYGDCTCAEIDHAVKTMQVAAGNPEVKSSAQEVLNAYAAITGWNPNDPSSDQGAEMQSVRDFWRKTGFTLGGKPDKVALFAQVDHTNLMLVRWCIDRFGEVGVGVNFPASAMDQFNADMPWDVVKGSQVEGGHAVAAVGYDAQYIYLVSWGRVVPATWAWFVAYTEECWTQLSTDWINAASGEDALGEVAYALGEQFRAVTGQANPFPAPSPAPAPTPQPAGSLPPDVTAWAQRTLDRPWHSKQDKKAAQELLDWAGGH